MTVTREVAFDFEGALRAWPGCPARTIEALRQYVEGHRQAGAFVMACLENDLRAAVRAADEEAYEALPHVVNVIDHFVPPQACGSKEAVAQWLRKSRKEASRA